jgi:hypothetical protein
MVESNNTKLTVLIADLFSESSIEELRNSNIKVEYNHALNGESLTKALAEI